MAKRDLAALLGDNGDGLAIGLEAKAYAATTAGTAVDMAASATLPGSEGLVCVINAGVCTDGKYVVTLTESDDNSTFTAVAATDISVDTTATINAAADQTVQLIGYIGDKRYVKPVITESSAGSTGVILSATMVRGFPRHLGKNLMA
jgi:hypothetical protein